MTALLFLIRHKHSRFDMLATTLRRCAFFAAATIAFCACAAGSSDDPTGNSFGEGPDAGPSDREPPALDAGAEAQTQYDGATPSEGGPVLDANPSDNDASSGGTCANGTSLIYVLGKNQGLYGFDPTTLTINQVGTLNCPQNGGTATPFSMAVDRNAVAWVLYNDGHLYQVQTGTAACAATSFEPNQNGFKKFGMGFVSNAPGTNEETLYAANEYGLGTIDVSSLVLEPVAGTFGFSAAAELTGTGDARLFGLFFGYPPYISELDKTDSQLLGEMPLDTIDIGTGFAYAFWGGDFWVFTAPNGTSSQVDRFEPTAGIATTMLVDVGFKIVGAGVSTCAPVTRPK